MRFEELAEIIESEIGENLSKRLLERLCEEASGESIYIPRRPGRIFVSQTDTVKTIQKKHSVSRSTAYNWVAKWRL